MNTATAILLGPAVGALLTLLGIYLKDYLTRRRELNDQLISYYSSLTVNSRALLRLMKSFCKHNISNIHQMEQTKKALRNEGEGAAFRLHSESANRQRRLAEDCGDKIDAHYKKIDTAFLFVVSTDQDLSEEDGKRLSSSVVELLSSSVPELSDDELNKIIDKYIDIVTNKQQEVESDLTDPLEQISKICQERIDQISIEQKLPFWNKAWNKVNSDDGRDEG